MTPSSRTNVRQLLHREQSLQQEQRNRPPSSNASSEGSGKRRQNRALSKDVPYTDFDQSYNQVSY